MSPDSIRKERPVNIEANAFLATALFLLVVPLGLVAAAHVVVRCVPPTDYAACSVPEYAAQRRALAAEIEHAARAIGNPDARISADGPEAYVLVADRVDPSLLRRPATTTNVTFFPRIYAAGFREIRIGGGPPYDVGFNRNDLIVRASRYVHSRTKGWFRP